MRRLYISVLLACFAWLKAKIPSIIGHYGETKGHYGETKGHYGETKGHYGEKRVAKELSALSNDEAIVLNDLMFKDGYCTTQIDHIVISVYGIFVIETKNYSGRIFGNSNKEYWNQNIWGNKYPLYNPILQNKNHIKFLTRKFNTLREKEQYIHSIVVYLGTSRLKLSGDCDNVLWLSDLNSYIRSYTQSVMKMEECHNIASMLQTESIDDKQVRINHKSNVNSIKHQYDTKVRNGICPRCGGELTPRKGKYGNFYGCSNYPRCRYTHQN